MLLIIDADQWCWACGFAAEGEPEHHAFKLIKNKIEEAMQVTGCEDYSLYIKGKGNFRDEVSIDYKSHRKQEKPKLYDAIRQYMIESHGAICVNGMEADDAVSIIRYSSYTEAEEVPAQSKVIVASPDKDLMNTPGWHYNPRTQVLQWITLNQANRHFLYQMLAGDTADNIKGLPSLSKEDRERYSINRKGVGPATAKKVMKTTESYQDAAQEVYDLYMNWGRGIGMSQQASHDYFIQQAQLLWMVREMDLGEPVMFHPSMVGLDL